MFAMQAPDWSIALLLNVLPAFELRRMLRIRRRTSRGLCIGCGYDLRASPARCPECGHLRR
jgi:predicted amidophosphoribosyltransferase